MSAFETAPGWLPGKPAQETSGNHRNVFGEALFSTSFRVRHFCQITALRPSMPAMPPVRGQGGPARHIPHPQGALRPLGQFRRTSLALQAGHQPRAGRAPPSARRLRPAPRKAPACGCRSRYCRGVVVRPSVRASAGLPPPVWRGWRPGCGQAQAGAGHRAGPCSH